VIVFVQLDMIKFGTSGWRAIMGEEFTFQNVRTVVQAIANYLKEKFGRDIRVIVNYDTRFLSERFALEAAKVLSHNRIHVCIADRDSPSQAQSFQIISRKAQGGINFTASFNPPEYNGLKFNDETGAPALPQVTDKIEEEIKNLLKQYSSCPYYSKVEYIEKIDLQQDYLNDIQKKIDFETIRKSGIKIGVDLLYGTSREYLDEILEENQIPIEELHGYIDPYFGGITPSCRGENLWELRKVIKEKNCHLGIATDSDGDRFGILNEKGQFVDADLILALLLEYSVTKKKLKGGIGRSVATTHLLDKIARNYGLELYRTPVGFKYLADLFLRKKIVFGAEESACLVIKGHLPEKDGIFAGLLVAEMISREGKNLSELTKELFKKYGRKVRNQVKIGLTEKRKQKLEDLFKNPPDKIKQRKVLSIQTVDGIKFNFSDDDWMLLRLSGTVPVIRCYAEAGTNKDLAELIDSGLELVE
jgi:phosphoglucomutase